MGYGKYWFGEQRARTELASANPDTTKMGDRMRQQDNLRTVRLPMNGPGSGNWTTC